jgi:hypothetical protein
MEEEIVTLTRRNKAQTAFVDIPTYCLPTGYAIPTSWTTALL